MMQLLLFYGLIKAMKSLLLKTKTKDEKITISNAISKTKEIREKLGFIWEVKILTQWVD